MPKQLNVDLSFRADTSQAKAAFDKLLKELNSLGAGSTTSKDLPITKEIQQAQVAAKELGTSLQAAYNSSTGKLDLSAFNTSLSKSGKSLSQYADQLSMLGKQGDEAFLKVARSIVETEAPLKRTNALLTEFATTMKNSVRWQLSSSMIHGFMGAISSAVGYAEDLNKSLNNIRIVTGHNTEYMAEFAKNANEAAKALSTSTTAYTDAALIFYQQGLDDDKVKERTDATIKMSNVTGDSVTEVSSYMTAIWNNFEDGTETLEHYADVITALGASTASSSAEIAAGLEKFAAIGNQIGLSYDYATSALATVVAQTRQSEDVVGTAFKTIFARIQGLTLGETQEDGTGLNKYSKALLSVGINIKDVNGEIKDMDVILDELGQKWGTLSKDTQIALAQTVAGVRQYNQLIALMDNWDFFQQNLDIARGANGTLQEQAEIYAESWEAAQKRVKASMQEVYGQILNDEFFIDMNNALAKSIDLISSMIDSMGGLKGVLGLAGVLITRVFQQDLSNGINNALQNFRVFSGVADKEIQQIRENAKSLAMAMTEGLQDVSGIQALRTSLETTYNLQEQLRASVKKMSPDQAAVAQEAMEMAKNYNEAAIAAAKAADAAEKAAIAQRTKNTQAAGKAVLTVQDNNDLALGKTGGELLGIAKQSLTISSEFIGKSSTEYLKLTEAIKGYSSVLRDANATEESRNAAASALLEAMNQHALKVEEITSAMKAFNEQVQGQAKEVVESAKSFEKYKASISEVDTVSEDFIKELKEFGKQATDLGLPLQKLQDKIEAYEKALKNGSEKDKTSALRELKAEFNKTVITTQQMDEAIVNSTDVMQENRVVLEDLREEFLATAATEREFIVAQENNTNATNNAAAAAEKAKKRLENMGLAFKSVGSNVTNLLNGISSLAMGLSSLKSIQDTLNNQDLSSFEKFLQVSMSLGMGLPMLASGLTALGHAFKWVTAATKEGMVAQLAYLVGIEAVTVAEEANTEATNINTVATLKNIAAKVILNPILWLAVAAIGAIAASLWFGIKAWNADADAVKKATEESEKANEALNETKNKINEVKNTLSKYDSALEGIKTLQEGTDEWRESVEELNSAVLDLMDTYKGLANPEYVTNENGVLGLTDAGRDYIEEQNRNRLSAATQNAYARKIDQYEADSNNEITNTFRGIQNDSGIVIAGDLRNALVEALKENPSGFLQDKDQIAEVLNLNSYDVVQRAQLNAIYDARESLIALANELNQNTIASNLLTDQMAANTAEEVKGFRSEGISDGTRDIITEMVGNALANTEDSSIWKNSYDKKDKSSVNEAYKNTFGVSDEDLKNIDLATQRKALNENEARQNVQNSISEEEVIRVNKALAELNEEYLKGDQTLSDYMKYQKEYEALLRSLGITEQDTIDALLKKSEIVGKAAQQQELLNKMQEKGLLDDNGKEMLKDDLMKFVQSLSKEELSVALKVIPEIDEGSTFAHFGTMFIEAAQEPLETYQQKLIEVFGTDSQEKVDKINNAFEQMAKALGGDVSAINEFADNFNSIDWDSNATSQFMAAVNSGDPEQVQELTAHLATLAEISDDERFGELASKYDLSKKKTNELKEEVKDYALYLSETAKESDELSDSLATDADAAASIASKIIQMNKGIETLADNIEDWSSVLKKSSKTSQEFQAAADGVREALSGILGVNEELISNDFISDAENLALIEKAATGDAEAIEALKSAMSEDIIATVELNKDEEVVARINQLDGVLRDLPDTVEVGAILDDSDFINAANEMVQKAGMTADQANAYFAGMGYEPVYSVTDVEHPAEMPNSQTITTVSSIAWETGEAEILGHNIPFKLPKITVDTQSTPLPSTKVDEKTPLVSFSGGETPPPIKGLRKTAPASSNNYSSSNKGGKSPGKSSGGGKKKGGGGKAKTPAQQNTAEKEMVERYKEITDSINDVAKAYDKASKAADRLFGKNRIKALEEQNKLLLKQKKLVADKEKEAHQYLKIDKQDLDDYAKKLGKTFKYDEDGDIVNYTEVLHGMYKEFEALENQYNAFKDADKQSEFKESKMDPVKEKIDLLKEKIKAYEETKDLIEELQEQQEELFRQWQDNNYLKLTYKLELKLNVDDNELIRLNYYLEKLSDNIYKAAEALPYLRDQIPEVSDKIETYQSSLEEISEAFSKGEISEQAYNEALQNTYESIYDLLKELIDLDKRMMHYYGDTLELADKEISKFTNHLEHLTSVMEHYKRILELTGQAVDYDKMAVVLNGIAKTQKNSFEVSKAKFEMLKQQRAEIEAQLNSAPNEAARELLRQELDDLIVKYDEAEEEMLSNAEAFGETINLILTTSLEKAMKDYEHALTNGMGFDQLNDSLSRLSTYQDEYLTKTNQIYEASKLQHQLNQDIEKTNNQTSKRMLKSFQSEIDSLREKDELSNLELEIAKAKYKMLQAQIALEEAQQAKSTVRLSRDSEGNYGYVYTADKDNLDSAQQDLLDAENDLYNLRLEATNDYGQKKLQAEQDFIDALAAIDQRAAEDDLYRETQYEEDRARIIAEYTALITTYSNLYAIAQEEDSRVVADAWVNSYAELIDNGGKWKEATTEYVHATDDAFKQWKDDMEPVRQAVGADLKELAQKTNDVTRESTQLANYVRGTVIPAIASELTAVNQLTHAYSLQRQELLALIATYEQYLNQLQQQIEENSGENGTNAYKSNDYYYDVVTGAATYEDAVAGIQAYKGYTKEQAESHLAGARAEAGSEAANKYAESTSSTMHDSYADWKKANGFATGGYTGAWGNEGKIAILHEKELVLNETDTSNMLNAIQILRDLSSIIDLNSKMASSFNSLAAMSIMGASDVLEQSVTIHAEFPNAINHNEIEQAFDTLINRASQYANR